MSEQATLHDARRSYRFWMDDALIDTYGPKIGAYGIALYALLARHARQGQCFPSYKHMMRQLNVSRMTIFRTLQTLEKEGLITKERRQGAQGDLISSLYTLTHISHEEAPSLPEIPPSTCEIPGGSTCEIPGSICEVLPSTPEGLHLKDSLLRIPTEDLKTLSVSSSEETSPRGERPDKLTAYQLMGYWNAMTASTVLPQVQKLTPERQRLIATRFAVHPERLFWTTVCDKVAASPFLRGERASQGHAFHATFDWLLKPGNALKVYEGNYDETPMERALERHGVKQVKQMIVNAHSHESFVEHMQRKMANGTTRPERLLTSADDDE